MRTITYGGAVSLDGFLTGPDEAMDWLHFSKDVQAITTAFWKDIDAILMGRKTYEFGRRMRGATRAATTSDRPSPKHKKKPSVSGGMRTYVFSRTLVSLDDDPGVELVRDDAVDFVGRLKREPGRDICLMGGGELAQALIAAGLVDRVGLNIHPVLLGGGTPAFRDPGHRVLLTLTETREIDGGCILATYTIRNASESVAQYKDEHHHFDPPVAASPPSPAASHGSDAGDGS